MLFKSSGLWARPIPDLGVVNKHQNLNELGVTPSRRSNVAAQFAARAVIDLQNSSREAVEPTRPGPNPNCNHSDPPQTKLYVAALWLR